MLCALIMSGGKGERFWPLSTDKKPKQFLNLIGNSTMIQMTFNRINKLIPIERIFIVTGKRYVKLVKAQLPNLPERNIIIEPVGRNTAPCITLSALIINKYYDNSSMIVLPSDHLITDEEKFNTSINNAYNYLKKNKNAVITFGMKPDRPETGYGYIKLNNKNNELKNNLIYNVEKFVEKPNREKAEEYFANGNYLWNGGMFLWNCSTILNLIKKNLRSTYDILYNAVNNNTDYEDIIEQKYLQVDNISIDYAVIEKIKNLYVIPCDFGWDDIGTWYAVERYRKKDSNNNILVGDVRNIQCSNNIVLGKEKPIIIAGLNDVFVVESDDVIFIGSKESIKNIKKIKEQNNIIENLLK